MPLITTVPTAWSAPVTLTADETWQVRGGPAFISTDASPAATGGTMMRDGQAVLITAGKTVRYRSFEPRTQISREAF